MMKQAYKSYRMIENVKMLKDLNEARFRDRVIEYTGMYVVILTVMFTFVLFATYFLVLNILFNWIWIK